jgi:hypothetical protein
MADTYECAVCHGVFEKGWTDEEANAEAAAIFGAAPPEDERDVVCDDCWVKLVNGGFLDQDWPMGKA